MSANRNNWERIPVITVAKSEVIKAQSKGVVLPVFSESVSLLKMINEHPIKAATALTFPRILTGLVRGRGVSIPNKYNNTSTRFVVANRPRNPKKINRWETNLFLLASHFLKVSCFNISIMLKTLLFRRFPLELEFSLESFSFNAFQKFNIPAITETTAKMATGINTESIALMGRNFVNTISPEGNEKPLTSKTANNKTITGTANNKGKYFGSLNAFPKKAGKAYSLKLRFLMAPNTSDGFAFLGQ